MNRRPRAKPDLRARAKAEPAVQAVLDVFGGEIEDVEEIDKMNIQKMMQQAQQMQEQLQKQMGEMRSRRPPAAAW